MKSQILAIKKDNLSTRASDIARQVGVSREYVRQVLKASNIDTKVPQRKKIWYVCNECRKPFLPHDGHKLFCSSECHEKFYIVTLECTCCHRPFTRLAYQVRFGKNPSVGDRLFFCSRTCQGKYIGEHHGFGAHPGNARHLPRKYDYDQVLKFKQEGCRISEIASRLTCSVAMIKYILYGIHAA